MKNVGYAPWLSDPDAPELMSDAEIAAAVEKTAKSIADAKVSRDLAEKSQPK